MAEDKVVLDHSKSMCPHEMTQTGLFWVMKGFVVFRDGKDIVLTEPVSGSKSLRAFFTPGKIREITETGIAVKTNWEKA
jgi:hypothetical protein